MQTLNGSQVRWGAFFGAACMLRREVPIAQLGHSMLGWRACNSNASAPCCPHKKSAWTCWGCLLLNGKNRPRTVNPQFQTMLFANQARTEQKQKTDHS
eukprot:692821-Amphidinium_carterae.1